MIVLQLCVGLANSVFVFKGPQETSPSYLVPSLPFHFLSCVLRDVGEGRQKGKEGDQMSAREIPKETNPQERVRERRQHRERATAELSRGSPRLMVTVLWVSVSQSPSVRCVGRWGFCFFAEENTFPSLKSTNSRLTTKIILASLFLICRQQAFLWNTFHAAKR